MHKTVAAASQIRRIYGINIFGLTIAYTGLQAAQTSINVTSHNLANINTKDTQGNLHQPKQLMR